MDSSLAFLFLLLELLLQPPDLVVEVNGCWQLMSFHVLSVSFHLRRQLAASQLLLVYSPSEGKQ